MFWIIVGGVLGRVKYISYIMDKVNTNPNTLLNYAKTVFILKFA